MGGCGLGHLGVVVGGQEHQAVGIEVGMSGRSAPDAGIGVACQLGYQRLGQIRVVERAPASVRVGSSAIRRYRSRGRLG